MFGLTMEFTLNGFFPIEGEILGTSLLHYILNGNMNYLKQLSPPPLLSPPLRPLLSPSFQPTRSDCLPVIVILLNTRFTPTFAPALHD